MEQLASAAVEDSFEAARWVLRATPYRLHTPCLSLLSRHPCPPLSFTSSPHVQRRSHLGD